MKVAIYCRTSTSEQFPEKQLADCREFCKGKGFIIVEELLEQVSGFKKNIKREKYEQVKEMARIGKIQAVVVWALDRWVRDRDTLLEDILVLKNYNCKIYSVKESWLDAINIDGSLGRTIQDFLLGLIGSLAQLESERKSERTRMAYANKTGRWGRKNLSDKTVNEVIEKFKQGLTFKKISESVKYYDKNRNERNVSVGVVHKIISKFKVENPTFKDSSNLEPIMNNIGD